MYVKLSSRSNITYRYLTLPKKGLSNNPYGILESEIRFTLMRKKGHLGCLSGTFHCLENASAAQMPEKRIAVSSAKVETIHPPDSGISAAKL